MATVMAAPTSAAAVSRFPHGASLSGEERAMAAFLENDVLDGFVRTRGSEQRIDVYLALDKVFCLDDTDGSVRVLQYHLTALLRAVHDDLQHATMKDTVHLALRTLSYLMFHKSLARCFTDPQVESFLTDMMSRLASTQDENFDMTRHDFLPRIMEALVLAIINPFKSRAIEMQALKGIHLLLVKFKPLVIARASTLRIWFRPVASRLSSSDPLTRQRVARILLETAEFAHCSREWQARPPGNASETEVTNALMEYALPAIQAHLTYERNHDALVVWKIVLLLMKRKLTGDLSLLNDLLTMAEVWMRHTDASVRLRTMETWKFVVGVFRQTNDWLFKRHVLVLLVGPLLLCVEKEPSLNVVHTAVTTWRVLVAAVVEDFNTYCLAQGESNDAIQQSGKKWKRWMDEVVKKMMSIAMARQQTMTATTEGAATEEGDHPGGEGGGGGGGAATAAVFEAIELTVRAIFVPLVVASSGSRNDNKEMALSVAESSITTAASSSRNCMMSGGGDDDAAEAPGVETPRKKIKQPTTSMDLSERDDLLLDEELRDAHIASSAASTAARLGPEQAARHSSCQSFPPLQNNLLAVALVHPSVLNCVQMVIDAASSATCSTARRRQYTDLAVVMWAGFCTRMAQPMDHEREALHKLRLRLVRISLDFAFGNSPSSSSSSSSMAMSSMDSQANAVLMPSLPTDSSVMTAADLIHTGTNNGSGGRPEHMILDFFLQLRFLHALLSATATSCSSDEWRALLQHPKSKLAQQLLTRIDAIVEKREQVYKPWLAQYDHAARSSGSSSAATSEERTLIDFSLKANIVLCVELYLLIKLAAAFGQTKDTADRDMLHEVVGLYGNVLEVFTRCVAKKPVESETPTCVEFGRVIATSPCAAAMRLNGHNQEEEESDDNRSADVAGGGAGGGGRFLKLCSQLAERSEESQENAEVLLQLQRSPVRPDEQLLSSLPSASTAVEVLLPASSLHPIVPPGMVKEEEEQLVPESPHAAGSPDGSNSVSPCMLQTKIRLRVAGSATTANNQPDSSSPPRRSPGPGNDTTATAAMATTPMAPRTPTRTLQSVLKRATATTTTPSKTTTPAKQPLQSKSAEQIVCAALATSTEPISVLQLHLSHASRTMLAFHKIATVGDLSGLSKDQVAKLGIKDAVATVTKALDDYQTRSARLKSANSPFRRPPPPRFASPQPHSLGHASGKSPGAATAASLLSSPSPTKISLKRPTGGNGPSPGPSLPGGASPSTGNRLPITPLPFESPQRKRARRSLIELSSERDHEEKETEPSGETPASTSTMGITTLTTTAAAAALSTSLFAAADGGVVVVVPPKKADRVTFRLDIGDGETKFTRPGEDSQDQANDHDQDQEVQVHPLEKKRRLYASKVVQYLERSLYYADKIVALSDISPSDGSAPVNGADIHVGICELHEALEYVSKLQERLGKAIKATAQRVQRAGATLLASEEGASSNNNSTG